MNEDLKKALEVYPSYCKMVNEKIGIRTYMWQLFSSVVAEHVQNYTIPQYDDYPNDTVTSWSVEDCLKQIEKYVKRFSTNQRGAGELERDLLKIAHYCSLAYLKKMNWEEEFLQLVSKEETSE